MIGNHLNRRPCPGRDEVRRRAMMALGIVRAGTWVETEADRIQQYCRTQGWDLAEPLCWVEGAPELLRQRRGVRGVVLQRGGLNEFIALVAWPMARKPVRESES